MYGEYPKTMQNIVGERLPKFSKEEVKIVKGAFDFIGVNQYTAYYMYDPHQPKSNNLGYQQDWNVGFACMNLFSPLLSVLIEFVNNFSYVSIVDVAQLMIFYFFADERHGVPIGPRVSSISYTHNLYLFHLILYFHNEIHLERSKFNLLLPLLPQLKYFFLKNWSFIFL